MEKSTDDFHRFGPRVTVGWAWREHPPTLATPWRAEFEEIHTRKSTNEVLRCRGSLAQDSAGRARQDIFFPDPGDPSIMRHVGVIFDMQELTYYFFDHETKQVQTIKLAPTIPQHLAGTTNAEGGPRVPPLASSPPPPR
jgi:hypothetical protein